MAPLLWKLRSSNAAGAGMTCSRRLQAWVELSTLEAPDYFGEAAVLRRGVRHATAIATSATEVLVLAKLDFDLKVDAATRDVVGVLVAQYPKDPQLLRCVRVRAGAACMWRFEPQGLGPLHGRAS